MRSSLKELRERRELGRTEAGNRLPSAIPLEVVLSATGAITEPVSLAKTLTGFGLPLDAAHAVLNRLVAGEAVPVILQLTPGGEMPFALCRFGLGLGRSIEPGTSANVDDLLSQYAAPSDLLSSFEHWRLSQPAQPPAREAIGLMIREYLVEHGLLAARQGRQETEPYKPE